jgi:glucokinase
MDSAIPPATPARPWLVADIGGTNARFGLVTAMGRPAVHVQRLAVADHAGPEQAIRAYLAGLASAAAPAGLATEGLAAAALAVATPVTGDEVSFTNSAWRFSVQGLQDALGLARLLVLNDFEALALSLPRLGPAQRHTPAGWLAPGEHPAQTLAVIGPGTGLGVGGVLPTSAGWAAIAGEGGHVTLAAADEEEAALLAWVRRSHGHVSAERLLSGMGLPLLHQAVAAVQGRAAAALSAEQIVSGGLSEAANPLCRETLAHFCAMLGGVAGNVVLTLGARGGLYIGGGIVPRLGDFFACSRFRERMLAKGRFADYLAAVPVAVITDTLAALAGGALALEQSTRPGPA